MNIDPSIITKSCEVLTPRQRLAAYRERLDRWMESAPAEAELVVKPKPIGKVVVGKQVVDSASPPIHHNVISACLRRKGGGK